MPSDFINAYLAHTNDYESPTSFWRWSAYAAIGAVLRDNVFRRQRDTYVYPSNYILLLARSSYDRKNNPITLCEQLVNKVANTKVISGRASVQGIMDELYRVETNKTTGKVVKGGAAIFFAPELGASIVEDPAAVKVLTDVYDFKPNPFKSILRTQPRFQIDKIVLSMFAASNAEMIKDTYNAVAVTGGLLARTILVIPNEFRAGNSLFDEVDTAASFENVVNLLTQVSELSGEFQIPQETKDEYNKWYLPFRESYRNKSEKTGILGRIHMHALKLAMILAANELSPCILKKHIEQAITECVALLPNYNKFAMGQGNSNISVAGEVVLSALLSAPGHRLSQKSLLSEHWSKFDLELLEKLTTTFEAGGLIERYIEGSEISYKLTPKCLEILEGKQKGAN